MMLMAPVPEGGYTRILEEKGDSRKECIPRVTATYSSSGSADGDFREGCCRTDRRTGGSVRSVMLPLAPLLFKKKTSVTIELPLVSAEIATNYAGLGFGRLPAVDIISDCADDRRVFG